MAANFALNPAAAMAGIVDCTTREGRFLFTEATKSLTSDDEKMDCTPTELVTFLKRVATRADLHGWDVQETGALVLPHRVGDPNPEWINLIEEYGRVPLDLIQAARCKVHCHLHQGRHKTITYCVIVYGIHCQLEVLQKSV